ncbi:PfkB family carbohydrate kinase [Brachybacterium alimentarium]|uniref:PfkB family carbohydrate kinase n=1 Tax=Brachybacterium alimentarium TaxID=47845 RepID=UPI000DF22C52|nr:PfkB family carbohydrate kinase [Brachybacterium alimentarium]RCS91752.1 sugar kinase [Brachybacterium alimentarium]
MPRVLHTAQALVDIVLEIDELPPRGGNANAQSEQWYAGGAVTTLVAAARTGAEAVHGGAHGTGIHGDRIREALAADGVRLSDRPRQEADTGYCTVLLEPSAERTFLTVYGAERDVTAASFATLAPQPGDLLCLSGYSLFEPTREPLLEFLESVPEGVEVVLDPGAPFATFPREVQERVLARTTVWTSNADEARALTGLEALEDTPEALRRRIGAHAVVIVRDGERGCTVFHHGRGTEIPAFPVTAVDTNGAGDTHTGVLLAERALGADWESAATRANAAASIAVTRKGPQSSPTRAEVDAFLA